MKNKFLFFAIFAMIALVLQSNAQAADSNGVAAVKETKNGGEAKIVTYSLKGADMPQDGTPLTFDEIENIIGRKDVYSWMSKPVAVPVISIRQMMDKKITENTDSFGENVNEVLHQSKALALVVKGESAQLRGELVKETRRVLGEIDRVFCSLLGETINATMSEGSDFTKVQSASGYIDGLWLEHHGFQGITVRLKLIEQSQRWEQYHDDGTPITDFQVRIVSGDLGGGQTCRTTKAYAIAFAKEDGSYCILTCPDVMASPLIDGMREIKLIPFMTNLKKEAAAVLLATPPFSLDPRAIHGYKDESGNLVPGLFAPVPDSGVTVVSTSVNTKKCKGGGN